MRNRRRGSPAPPCLELSRTISAFYRHTYLPVASRFTGPVAPIATTPIFSSHSLIANCFFLLSCGTLAMQ
jgi:hypothetical protein